MSNLINKVKEKMHSDKKDNDLTDNPRSDNAGPHGSNMANTIDPRVDSDRDNYRQPGVNQGGVGGAGYQDPAVGGAHQGQHGHHQGHHGHQGGVGQPGGAGGNYNDPSFGGPGNPQSGNAGPHNSNFANKADPRVDSDRDGGRNLGAAGQGYGGQNTGPGGAGYGGPGNPQSSNAGPHNSNFANKMDPRVDSDRDGSRNMGAAGQGGAGYGGQHQGAGYGGNTGGAGYNDPAVGGGYGGPGNPQSSNAGPHNSNLANRADPRVDSDLDGGRHAGFGPSGTGHASNTGYDQGGAGFNQGGPGHHQGGPGHHQGGPGHHQGGSGYNQGGPGYNQGGAGGYDQSATPGSGNANTTAGPHNSNLLNKLDPRVDSDVDGSKTVGGNQTYR